MESVNRREGLPYNRQTPAHRLPGTMYTDDHLVVVVAVAVVVAAAAAVTLTYIGYRG